MQWVDSRILTVGCALVFASVSSAQLGGLGKAQGTIRDGKELGSGVNAMMATPKDKAMIAAVAHEVREIQRAILGDRPELDRIAMWPQLQVDAESMMKKFKMVDTGRYTDKDFAVSLDFLRTNYAVIKEKIEKEYPRTEGDALKAQSTTLRTVLTAAVNNKMGAAFTKTIPYLAGALQKRADAYDFFVKGKANYPTETMDGIRALLKEADEATVKLESEIIGMNVSPVDVYGEADREALRKEVNAEFLRKHPEAKVIKVYMTEGAWVEDLRWSFSEAAGWYKADASRLKATVVVEGADALAYLYPVQLTKDHQEKNRLSITVPKELGRPSHPKDILLASKIS